MVKVQYLNGPGGGWNLAAAPMTLQAALGHARAIAALKLSDRIEIVSERGDRSNTARLIDVLV